MQPWTWLILDDSSLCIRDSSTPLLSGFRIPQNFSILVVTKQRTWAVFLRTMSSGVQGSSKRFSIYMLDCFSIDHRNGRSEEIIPEGSIAHAIIDRWLHTNLRTPCEAHFFCSLSKDLHSNFSDLLQTISFPQSQVVELCALVFEVSRLQLNSCLLTQRQELASKRGTPQTLSWDGIGHALKMSPSQCRGIWELLRRPHTV